MVKRIVSVGAALIVLALANMAAAVPVTGLVSYSNPLVWPNADNQDHSLGWEFAVGAGGVTATALGYNYFGTPLNANHKVGIYDSTQQLLGSVTVDNSSTLYQGYLYSSLGSPLFLAPGDYFIVGTTLGLNDGWVFQAENIVTDPSITYLSSWFVSGTAGQLAFPGNPAGERQYLEVNLQLAPAAVPEPATLILFGSGIVGLVMSRRRRRR